MSQRVASRTDVTSIAPDGEEPGGHSIPQPVQPGFGAAPTAPDLRRNQRQLLVTPIFVIVEVGDFLGFKLNQSFTPVNRQCLTVFFRDYQPAVLVNFLGEDYRLLSFIGTHAYSQLGTGST